MDDLKQKTQAAWDEWHQDLEPDTMPETPNPSFSIGFWYGYRQHKMETEGDRAGSYKCGECGKVSVPDYGRCAFCGVKKRDKERA